MFARGLARSSPPRAPDRRTRAHPSASERIRAHPSATPRADHQRLWGPGGGDLPGIQDLPMSGETEESEPAIVFCWAWNPTFPVKPKSLNWRSVREMGMRIGLLQALWTEFGGDECPPIACFELDRTIYSQRAKGLCVCLLQVLSIGVLFGKMDGPG